MNPRGVLALAGVIVALLLAIVLWRSSQERTTPTVIAPEPTVPVFQRARPDVPPVLVIAARSEELRRVASALAGAYLERIGYRIDPGADDLVIGREGERVVYIELGGTSGQQVEFGLVEGHEPSDPAVTRVVVGLVVRGGANATPLAIRSENDPTTRRLMLTTRGDAPAIGEFTAFALSRDGQAAIEAGGAHGMAGVIAEEAVTPEAPADYQRIARRALRTSFTIRFRPGSDEFDERARDDLQRIADLMREPQNTGRQVRLLGFAGGETAADASRALAQLVAERLEDLAVPVGEVIGLGTALPVDSNGTPAGRWRNRRVEVWINR